LGEQETWIRNLEEQVGTLQKESDDVRAAIAAEHQQLGLDPSAGPLPAISRRTLAALRPLARQLGQVARQRAKAHEEAQAAQATAESLRQEIDKALADRGQQSLADALDRAGNEVAQLRRRVQLDQRLDEMSKSQATWSSEAGICWSTSCCPPGSWWPWAGSSCWAWCCWWPRWCCRPRSADGDGACRFWEWRG